MHLGYGCTPRTAHAIIHRSDRMWRVGFLSDDVECAIAGDGQGPILSACEHEDLAWMTRGFAVSMFPNPATLASALGLDVVHGLKTAELVVQPSRILIGAQFDARARSTVIAVGVATSVLLARGRSFNEADSALLCCEIFIPPRLVQRCSLSMLALSQKYISVGVLAAWWSRCCGQSGRRRKKDAGLVSVD
jgi:hypothetical protein